MIVGLAEVRSQIEKHLFFEVMTMQLRALRAMLDRFSAERTEQENVKSRIVEAESWLKCPFNRNMGKLMVLLFREGFVVLTAEAMPSTCDWDWRWDPKCHR